jgi:hypothetical protein
MVKAGARIDEAAVCQPPDGTPFRVPQPSASRSSSRPEIDQHASVAQRDLHPVTAGPLESSKVKGRHGGRS